MSEINSLFEQTAKNDSMALLSNITKELNSNLTSPVTDFASWRPYFYICYVIFGGSALLVNLLIICTLLKHKHLLYKWPTVSAMAMANMASALHSFCYGVYRLPLIQAGTIDQPMNVWICMVSLMPTFHVLAYSIPPVIQCIIGGERLGAICAFNWYRINWSHKKTWYAMAAITFVTILASAIPLWYRVFSGDLVATRECSSPKIIGVDYLFSVIEFAIIIGVASAVCSIAAALIGRFRINKVSPTDRKIKAQFQRQLKLSWSMCLVAIFDLILVTVPSFLTVMEQSVQMPDSAKISLFSLSYCVYSTVNIIVCVIMNSSLRKAVKKALQKLSCKIFPHTVTPPPAKTTVIRRWSPKGPEQTSRRIIVASSNMG